MPQLDGGEMMEEVPEPIGSVLQWYRRMIL
jgi:hypothetical protein